MSFLSPSHSQCNYLFRFHRDEYSWVLQTDATKSVACTNQIPGMATPKETSTLFKKLKVHQPDVFQPRVRVSVHGGYYILRKSSSPSMRAMVARPGFCHSLEFAPIDQRAAHDHICANVNGITRGDDHSSPLEPHLFNFESLGSEGNPRNWTWAPGCGPAQAYHYTAMEASPLERPDFRAAAVRAMFPRPAARPPPTPTAGPAPSSRVEIQPWRA